MESDLLCFIPESLCSVFAEHIFKGVGRKNYRQIVIYGGMQRISSFTIRFLGWMI